MPRRSWAARHLPTFTAAAQWVGRLGGGARVAAVAYAGAVVNRLTADWILTPLASADREIRSDLQQLRVRARELARNDSYASRFLSLLKENVIGPAGITLQARNETGAGEPNEAANAAIEAAWGEWSRPLNCTTEGKLSFTDVCDLAIETVARDGEFLARIVGAWPGNPFGLTLQLLDADQLDHQYDRPAVGAQNEIRMGVEISPWGRPVAYHVFKGHPADYQISRISQDRTRIPASQIIHLFTTRRPGQTRGVTWFAPVLLDKRMLYGLQEAELVASRIAAAKGGFFTQDPASAPIPDPNNPNAAPKRVTRGVEPGTWDTLPPGLTPHEVDPKHPNTAFGDFNKIILRSIATGWSTSYHALTGDLTEVSFSSIRDGTLRDRDVYKRLQRWFIEQFLERVYPQWLLWALTTGALKLPTRDVADWSAREWQPRGWNWVDPLKDALTLEKEIELGINSRTRAAAERGRDFPAVVKDLQRERRMLEEAGLLAPAGTGPSALTVAAMTDEEYERFDPFRGLAPNGNGNGRRQVHAR